MGQWKKTNCSLCVLTCGLEVEVENNKIIRSRGDYANPVSEGHACRKGRNIAFFQDSKDRLRYPMKRVGENEFIRISWDQAIDEVSAKLRNIVDTYGPRSLAGTNMGSFGGQLHGTFGVSFLYLMGTRYRYSNLAAELTGLYWSFGRMLGSQGYIMDPDAEGDEGEMLICSGWNGYVSNNSSNGKRVCSKYARDPNKILAVIDPRKSETAQIADIHLAIRPGTDTVLWRAVNALILQEKWYDQAYIDEHIADFDQILPWFEGVDVKKYCEFCGLAFEDVYNFVHLIATKRTSCHPDLGVICGRNSTLTTHLENIALAICGHLLMPGGNIYSGSILPVHAHTDNRDPDNWKTVVTGFPTLSALHPTAVLAEEIDNDNPLRVRALLNVCQNPMNSYVDVPALEKAFKKLELLVTVDCQMSETARMSDYVLPMQTPYETWESSGMLVTFPYIYGQLRPPVVEPKGDILPSSEIFMRLTDKLNLLPEFPQELYDDAQGSRMDFQQVLLAYFEKNPQMQIFWPHILAKTLGPVMGSINKAVYWGCLLFATDLVKDAFERCGYKKGPNQAEEIFQDVLRQPEGINVGQVTYDDLFKYLQTPDKKIHVFAEELDEWVYKITPEEEEKAMTHPEFPFVLFSGRHCEVNANGSMRNNPEWVYGKPFPQLLTVHPDDAKRLGISEGQMARLSTENGHLDVPVTITREIRRGCVQIPHGFGMNSAGVVSGVNINHITKNTNRDPFAGTPYIRYVPCKVEAIRKEA